MDKYATLGTLYELKKSRQRRRAEMHLLPDLVQQTGRVVSAASSPDLPSLLSAKLSRGSKSRAHSISACVSVATKCALSICGEEEERLPLDVVESGKTSPEDEEVIRINMEDKYIDRLRPAKSKIVRAERNLLKLSKENAWRLKNTPKIENDNTTSDWSTSVNTKDMFTPEEPPSKEEKWSASVEQELVNKGKHSRDCDCEESTNYLKVPVTIKITDASEEAPAELNVDPKRPESVLEIIIKGDFNPTYLPKKVPTPINVEMDSKLLTLLRRIRPKSPSHDSPAEDGSESPWFQVCSVRRRSRPASVSYRGPGRPSSPIPSSVLYCARTRLRSFSHIMDKIENGLSTSRDSVSCSAGY